MQLSQWPELRLIQIVAPAGYGKTSLAAAWAHSLADQPTDQRPAIVWVPLSASDGASAEQLLRTLIDALEPHLPRLRDLRNADGGVGFAAPFRVQTFCRELVDARHSIVLVLDDVHLLADAAAHALLQHILDAAPAALHLALLARTSPPLRLGRLILDDAILTLTEQDLALDHDEFLALVHNLGIGSQPPEILSTLEQRTTGWVTGLKLLAYDLRYDLPAARALSADDALDEFFESRVLSSLAPELQSFVTIAATLPYMTADLLAAVSQLPAHECAERLNALAAANSFVTPFGAPNSRATTYRFHPLFHDFLRRRAVQLPLPDADLLEHRAAVWLCDHDEVDEALALMDSRPLTADGRPQSSPLTTLYSDSLLLPAVSGRPSAVDFLDSLARAFRRAVLRYNHGVIKRWLRSVPADWIAAHAPLAVAVGWHAWAINPPDIQDMLAPWQRAVDAVAVLPDAPAFDELRAEGAMLQALRHLMLSEHDALERVVAAAEKAPHDPDGLAAAYLHLLRAAFIDVAADVESRFQRLQIAAQTCENIGFGHGSIEMMYAQLLLKQRSCQFEFAQATAAQLQANIARDGWRLSIYVPEIHHCRGEMYYLTDQLHAARASLQLTVDNGRADGPTPTENAYAAQVLLQMCDAAESPDGRAVFDFDADAAAWAEITHNKTHMTRCIVAWPRLLRDFRSGRFEACRHTFEGLGMQPGDLDVHLPDRIQLAVLAGAVFSGITDDVITAKLADLRSSSQIFSESSRFDLKRMQVQSLQALHAHQRGDAAEARRHLHELLADVEHTGIVRILLDMPSLRKPLSTCDGPLARRLAARMAAASPTPQDYGLTQQEAAILTRLTDGLSPKAIAAALNLTVGTVRVHTNNIYRKLQVNSRAEAVQVWRGQPRPLPPSAPR